MRLSGWLAVLVFASVWLAPSVRVAAEGSAELDAADPDPAINRHDQALTQTTVLHVDIVDGTNEQICWRGTGALNVFQPAPNEAMSVAANVASGACAAAINGVNGPYLIDVLTNQALGSEWDIRVCPKTATAAVCLGAAAPELLGRLYAGVWIFEHNGGNYSEPRSINGSVYAIVPGGGAGRDAVIELQLRGVSGAAYRIAANGIGPETTADVRVGRSVAQTGDRELQLDHSGRHERRARTRVRAGRGARRCSRQRHVHQQCRGAVRLDL
jgi:hypothetical protein